MESVDRGHGREQRQHWQSYFNLELEMASTHAEEQRESEEADLEMMMMYALGSKQEGDVPGNSPRLSVYLLRVHLLNFFYYNTSDLGIYRFADILCCEYFEMYNSLPNVTYLLYMAIKNTTIQ